MTKTEKLLKLLNEKNITYKDILKPEKHPRVTNLGFSNGSKIPNVPTHMISKDGWLRGERTKVGMMFRSVRLTSRVDSFSKINMYQISYQYYPDNTGDLDDIPKNWKRGTGWLWVSDDKDMPDIKDIIDWMNKQQKVWIP